MSDSNDDDIASYFDGNNPEEQEDNMRKLEEAASSRHLDPVRASDYMSAVAETLRAHKEIHGRLAKRHEDAMDTVVNFVVGLKHLEPNVSDKHRIRLFDLRAIPMGIYIFGKQIDYNLGKCGRILLETSTNSELIADTIKNPLTDKNTKVAVQKELKLRLDDLENAYKQCDKAISGMERDNKDVEKKIDTLVKELGIPLPPVIEIPKDVKLKLVDESVNKEVSLVKQAKASLGQVENKSTSIFKIILVVSILLIIGYVSYTYYKKRKASSMKKNPAVDMQAYDRDVKAWCKNKKRDPEKVKRILRKHKWLAGSYSPDMKSKLETWLNSWYTLSIKKLPKPATK